MEERGEFVFDASGDEIQSARSSCKENSVAADAIPSNTRTPSTNLVQPHLEEVTKTSVNSSVADAASSKVKPAALISKDEPTAAVRAQTTSSSAETNGTASVTSAPDGAEIFVGLCGKWTHPDVVEVKAGQTPSATSPEELQRLLANVEVKTGSIVNVTATLEK